MNLNQLRWLGATIMLTGAFITAVLNHTISGAEGTDWVGVALGVLMGGQILIVPGGGEE